MIHFGGQGFFTANGAVFTKKGAFGIFSNNISL